MTSHETHDHRWQEDLAGGGRFYIQAQGRNWLKIVLDTTIGINHADLAFTGRVHKINNDIGKFEGELKNLREKAQKAGWQVEIESDGSKSIRKLKITNI